MSKRRSTTARGLGWSHEQAKRQLPDPEGAPCPFCGRPMLAGQLLDADHPTARAVGGGGGLRWSHRFCNRSAGARLGNLLRGRLSGAPRWADRWS